MAAPKQIVLLIGEIFYAHDEWEALNEIAEIRVWNYSWRAPHIGGGRLGVNQLTTVY